MDNSQNSSKTKRPVKKGSALSIIIAVAVILLSAAEAGDFDLKCNLDSIDLAGIAENSDDEQELLALIREHAERTGSPLAARILANWPSYRPKFVKVMPTKE